MNCRISETFSSVIYYFIYNCDPHRATRFIFFFFYQKDATFFVNAQYWQTTTDVSGTHFSTNVSLLRRNQQLSMMSDKKCPTANTRWGVCDLSNFMNKWQRRNETWKCTKDGLCAQLTADLHSFVSSIKAVIFPNLITLPHNGGRRTADVTAYPNHCGHFLTNITIHAGVWLWWPCVYTSSNQKWKLYVIDRRVFDPNASNVIIFTVTMEKC